MSENHGFMKHTHDIGFEEVIVLNVGGYCDSIVGAYCSIGSSRLILVIQIFVNNLKPDGSGVTFVKYIPLITKVLGPVYPTLSEEPTGNLQKTCIST